MDKKKSNDLYKENERTNKLIENDELEDNLDNEEDDYE
jgi:hypothetical protein